MTICAECYYLVDRSRCGNKPMWYDLYCGHPDSLEEREVNYVTGKRYSVKERMQHARDVNTCGECPLFKKKVI